jgi:hypothetical protein
MIKTPLLLLFLLLNTLAAIACFKLWNTSSLAAGSAAIAFWVTGGLGSFLGGFLASRKLYSTPQSHWLVGFAAAAVPLGLSFLAFSIDHPAPEGGPFPTHPWHEFGIVFIYVVISTLWLLVQATRTK